eukprot:scaffold7711_cov36-Phaeocystis_antarctica.AAC.2
MPRPGTDQGRQFTLSWSAAAACGPPRPPWTSSMRPRSAAACISRAGGGAPVHSGLRHSHASASGDTPSPPTVMCSACRSLPAGMMTRKHTARCCSSRSAALRRCGAKRAGSTRGRPSQATERAGSTSQATELGDQLQPPSQLQIACNWPVLVRQCRGTV